MQNLKDNNSLFCIDWKEFPHELYGSLDSGQEFSALEVMFMPCASAVPLLNGTIISADDTCIWDEAEVTEYLG